MSIRTIGSILLALTLLFVISVSAFASDTGAVDPTIIISAPTEPPQVVGTDPTPVDPEPTPETPSVIVNTGAGTIVTGAIGAGSVVTALGYYIASRKKLNR